MKYYKEEFLTELEKKLGWVKYNASRTEIMTMCPYSNCDVERGKKDHGHCYIDVDKPVFYCQRCNVSGSVFKLIRKLGIRSQDVFDLECGLFDFSGKYSSVDTRDLGVITNFHNLKVFKQDTELYPEKLDYLRSRMGYDYDVDKIPNLVLNISEFVIQNNIELNKFDLSNLKKYDKNFVGFLSNRGSCLILRNVTDYGKRYHKINIVSDFVFKDFYGFENNQNENPNCDTVVLAEGVFDILVGYTSNELSDLKRNSIFWSCAMGAYYKKLVASVVDYTKIPYLNVVVLSDKDKKPNDRIYYFLNQSPMVKSLKLYYNNLGKDFGTKPIEVSRVIYKNDYKKFDITKLPKQKSFI